MSAPFGLYTSDGLLFNAHAVGIDKLLSEPAPGVNNCYTVIKHSASKHGDLPAVSERSVQERKLVDGMEKLLMGPYSTTTFSDYLRRIDAFGSGLHRLAGLQSKDTVVRFTALLHAPPATSAPRPIVLRTSAPIPALPALAGDLRRHAAGLDAVRLRLLAARPVCGHHLLDAGRRWCALRPESIRGQGGHRRRQVAQGAGPHRSQASQRQARHYPVG
eukprot:scaffold8571_cov118-Isochrysis_galbana.AAC.2